MAVCACGLQPKMTKEIKTKTEHYYKNDAGQYHGEYKLYYKNGQLWIHCHFKNGHYHGEYKWYGENGDLYGHTYDVNDVEVHNFLDDGDSELIRVCLYIAHGAPFLT